MRSAAKLFFATVFAFVSLADADSHGSPGLHTQDTCAVSLVTPHDSIYS